MANDSMTVINSTDNYAVQYLSNAVYVGSPIIVDDLSFTESEPIEKKPDLCKRKLIFD